jgi:hypothetical protein
MVARDPAREPIALGHDVEQVRATYAKLFGASMIFEMPTL